MTSLPFRLHTPGKLGLGAVLDLGLKCVHSCRFCYYSFHGDDADQFGGLRRAGFTSLDDCKRILDLFAAHGYQNFDITGGEPALYPDLPEIVAHATGLGLASRVITLGQLLLTKDKKKSGLRLLDLLLDAGLTSFLFSLHAPDEANYRAFTGGSLNTLLEVCRILDAGGFEYAVNTVVFKDNLDMLPDIAALSASLGTYCHNFIMFNAYHQWDKKARAAGLQASFAQVTPLLSKAVDILCAAPAAVNLRYFPYCAVKGLERHLVGVTALQYDPNEWRNRAGRYAETPEFRAQPVAIEQGGVRPRFALRQVNESLPDGTRIVARRGESFNVFAEACADCRAMSCCDGADPKYLARFGTRELSPYAVFEAKGPLPVSRLAYLPAFVVKTAQRAGLRQALVQMGATW